MYYSQDSTNDNLEIDSYKIDSIPHTTATEERALWRNYIKWRYIKRFLGSESVLDDIHEASAIVISQVIEEISNSHDLIVSLRHHSGLDELGDIVIEDAEDSVKYMTEVARLIFKHSEKKYNDESALSLQKTHRSETCCLKEILGSIFTDMLNNIAFGKGNPNLVYKITKEIGDDPADIKDQLYSLAINRELLPRSIIKIFNPDIPLKSLPSLIKSIPQDSFSDYVSHYYQPFVLGIKEKGEEAFNRIIESHLWLVVDIVNKHSDGDVDLPRDDLIQEGNLGLIEAAKRFNPTLSTRFMQYATWWIYQKIQRAIADQARIIRVPVHMIERIEEFHKVSQRLAQVYGREPTVQEIGQKMGMSSEKIREIIKVAQLPISLELPESDEEDSQLVDIVEDHDAISPIDTVASQLLMEQIDKVLSTLTYRQQRVIKLRFGLEDGRSRTLEEIGQEFKVTRERIRQIEDKALQRLRHPSRSRKLKDFL